MTFRNYNQICLNAILVVVASMLINGWNAGRLPAQMYHGNYGLMRGNSPPGIAAQTKVLSNPSLAMVMQPVRLVTPDGIQLAVGGGGAFTAVADSKVTVNLAIGPVYRFQLSQIPNEGLKQLYPSVELLGRLHPPQGLELDFPIEIVIDKEDIDHALEGRMVTKVIYLEDSQVAMPHRHQQGKQPVLDISSREDPMRAAETMGRPLAILRLGSRVPTLDASDSGFGFHSPMPVILPEASPQNELGPIQRLPNELPESKLLESELPKSFGR